MASVEFWALYIPVLIAAPVIGSFLATAAIRIERGENFVLGRSRCDHCHRILAVRDLIPLISAVSTDGRCRHCGARIDRFHSIIELTSLLIPVALILMAPDDRFWPGLCLGFTLLFLAAVDARTMTLPLTANLALVAGGIAFSLSGGPVSFSDSLLGTGTGYLAFYLISRVYAEIRGQDGLGGGDAILFAAGGAWTGWYSLPWIALLGSVAALLWLLLHHKFAKKKPGKSRIPFGPFLCFVIFFLFLYF